MRVRRIAAPPQGGLACVSERQGETGSLLYRDVRDQAPFRESLAHVPLAVVPPDSWRTPCSCNAKACAAVRRPGPPPPLARHFRQPVPARARRAAAPEAIPDG